MKGIDILFFITGAAAGAAVSYFIISKKKDAEMQNSIQEIREVYEERIDNIKNSRIAIEEMDKKKVEMMHDLEEKVEAEKLSQQNESYTDYTASFKKTEKETDSEPFSIKIISEREAQNYSENKDFELVGLSLYDDDVLIDDETENIIRDFESWIGEDGISEVRKSYENGDSIYILNKERKAVYDITVIEERFGNDDEPVTIK